MFPLKNFSTVSLKTYKLHRMVAPTRRRCLLFFVSVGENSRLQVTGHCGMKTVSVFWNTISLKTFILQSMLAIIEQQTHFVFRVSRAKVMATWP